MIVAARPGFAPHRLVGHNLSYLLSVLGVLRGEVQDAGTARSRNRRPRSAAAARGADHRGVRQSQKKLRRPWKAEWNAAVDRATSRGAFAAAGSGFWSISAAQHVAPRPSRHDRAVHRCRGRRAGDGPPAPRLRARQRHRTALPRPAAVRVGGTIRRPRHGRAGHERQNSDRSRSTRRRLLPRRRSRHVARNLKAILLDQTVVAGVGNIYADEACFRAKLHPGRQGKSLTPAECDRLRKAIETVLTRAIESRGSHDPRLRRRLRPSRRVPERVRVYGRTGEPCRDCRAPRSSACDSPAASSHYCPVCQQIPPRRTPSTRRKLTVKLGARNRNLSSLRVLCVLGGETLMSYRAFKRLLGETSLERKCRWLLGAGVLLLMTGSFWVYARQTERPRLRATRRRPAALLCRRSSPECTSIGEQLETR